MERHGTTTSTPDVAVSSLPEHSFNQGRIWSSFDYFAIVKREQYPVASLRWISWFVIVAQEQ
jgi:hypothetical protein